MSSTEIISSTEEAAPKTEKANFDDEFADLLGDFGGGGGGGDASQVVVENGHGDTEEFVNIGAPGDGGVLVKTTTTTASVDADTVVVSQTTDVVDNGAVTMEPEAVHDNEVTTHAEVLHDGDVITEEHQQQQDQELNPSESSHEENGSITGVEKCDFDQQEDILGSTDHDVKMSKNEGLPEDDVDHLGTDKEVGYPVEDQQDIEKDLPGDEDDYEITQQGHVPSLLEKENHLPDQENGQLDTAEVSYNTSSLSDANQNQDPGAWIGGEKPADSDDEAGRETVRSEADEEPRGSSFVDTLSDYQPPRRVTKEDKKESGRAASVVIMGGAAENMCKVCGKRVYEMEKMLADKAIYHKICFKCIHCNRVLNLNNFASLDGNMYCKPHFMELFKAKGNYEEGFGKERHKNQWASGEAASTRKEPAAAAAVVAEETEAQPADIIRADEKPEDDRENLPSIRNLKSRFESQENDSTENLARGRKYGSGDVNTQGEKEQRPKQTQVSTQFYEPEAAPAPASSSKKPSKWDKPKEAPPPPINRVSEDSSEDATDNDLPPTSMARNLVSRFQDIGKSDDDRGPEVKPVRKMTPPREEVGRDVEEFQRQREEAMEASFDVNIVRSGEPLPSEQEELPAPSTTKNLLARFKSMEDMSSTPITPILPTTSSSTISSKKVSRAPVTVETSTVVNVQQVNHISPDSGVAVSESDTYTSTPSASHIQHEEVVEGGVYENEPVRMEDVFRESDVDEEKELPEQGFTRNLLAQWRNIENKTGTPPPQVEKPSTTKTQSWSYKDSSKAKSNVVSKSVEEVRAVENGLSQETEPTDQVVREVVRESDNSEEQFLPPPAYTKNILQRFKSMETQEPSSVPGATPKREVDTSKQQFKWQVKEARHLAWPGSPTAAPGEADPINYDNLVRAEDQMESEDSKPAPATTRSLLSRFQVDTNAPPPTPEESTKKQQAAVKSLKHVPTHDSPAPAHHQEEPSEHNGQPDAGEYENEPQQQEDVVRESDMTEEEELPGQGTTKNLLAKFQSMQPT